MLTNSDLKAAEQLRRALQLFAETLPEAQAREVAAVYPAYQTGRAYKAGEYLTDGVDTNGDPLLYKVVQDHTSADEWPPEITPSLYTCVSLGTSDWPIWSQPTGAHDAYNAGDVVDRNGTLYKSKIDGNVWDPEQFPDYWEVYEVV
ncbi:hypothetical protein D1641_01315 [Colidextribacter sp. OB.20]|uniref:hypothetical protein n=1 Tax=Colidextribacter sp. OB.20 TaxID=2304568 RepID=UPI001367DBAC|nr:hypothetical protein [Colidextribacter sp. OB.20]NBI08659.1 hypothetical protein [Colidextribacter sp. OB.20]